MGAPVNVKLDHPTEPVTGWEAQARLWQDLNEGIHGNPGFYPLTIKAAYVLGIIYALCKSVDYLFASGRLEHTCLPAYGIFASGMELLGRCINGNTGTSGNVCDLKTGFKWLKTSNISEIKDSDTLITTGARAYDVETLVALRHFAAHGQAASRMDSEACPLIQGVDYEILSKMPPLLSDGLERYWSALQRVERLCNHLAMANVLPLRGWPVKESWTLFEKPPVGDYRGVGTIFGEFLWMVKPDLLLNPLAR